MKLGRIGWLIVSVLMIGAVIPLTGCDEPSTDEMVSYARSAGVYSVLGWIAIDSPSVEDMGAVVSVLGDVKRVASGVTNGTYTATLYPVPLEIIIDSKVSEDKRVMVKAGVVILLNGIDTMFIIKPEWKKKQDVALSVVNSFIEGAQQQLGVDESDPVMMQARSAAAVRAKVIK